MEKWSSADCKTSFQITCGNNSSDCIFCCFNGSRDWYYTIHRILGIQSTFPEIEVSSFSFSFHFWAKKKLKKKKNTCFILRTLPFSCLGRFKSIFVAVDLFSIFLIFHHSRFPICITITIFHNQLTSFFNSNSWLYTYLIFLSIFISLALLPSHPMWTTGFLQQHRAIKLSSPKLSNITAFGCILVYAAVILLGLDYSTLPANEKAFPIVCTVSLSQSK